MLCDERFLACIIPLSDEVEPAARPAELDQTKATRKTKIEAECYCVPCSPPNLAGSTNPFFLLCSADVD
jgi:hypothetical protein